MKKKQHISPRQSLKDLHLEYRKIDGLVNKRQIEKWQKEIRF